MARTRRSALSAARLAELRNHYLEQLPTLAVLLAVEQDGEIDFDAAAVDAVDAVDAVLAALEGGE